ncbi:MAG: multiheme c-type cytochrome [Alphaproteobacteria bacterium]|nr:multiheme c-type cytochrome [Alphaproteobacteria bacterium]
MPVQLKALLAAGLWLASAPAVAGMADEAKGIGLYGDSWRPDPVHEYWDPGAYHRPERELVEGRFAGAECVECHQGVTPGIVNGWRQSRHAKPAGAAAPVACDGCHGGDHQALRFPTPADCGACHDRQHGQFLEERRYGFPSHALAMERAVDAKHFVDKPKAEVASCLQCHSVATKCDSCHTRHAFSAAEARRPEACITCHSGPPHPDDETYFASAHGRRYLAEGAGWDWSKPLVKGNYPVPTCAYCHMREGRHQVADKAIWKFGIREVNPRTAENNVKRRRWIAVCADCHEPDQAKAWLAGLDDERKRAWAMLYEAEAILRDLRGDDLLHPAPGARPPYPLDWWEQYWPIARIGFYEGQASAFYNVSGIERDYFEMWYFDGLGAYKAAAHGAPDAVREGHDRLARSLERVRAEAASLRALGTAERAAGVRADPGPLWLRGPYTDLNRERN